MAERLGTPPVTFPGDHGGFLGGEHGQTGEPDAFAATLHKVLAGLDGLVPDGLVLGHFTDPEGHVVGVAGTA